MAVCRETSYLPGARASLPAECAAGALKPESFHFAR